MSTWSLGYEGTVLVHDGGYGVALDDISGARDVAWWMNHLLGKGWGSPRVVQDFYEAAIAAGVA